MADQVETFISDCQNDLSALICNKGRGSGRSIARDQIATVNRMRKDGDNLRLDFRRAISDWRTALRTLDEITGNDMLNKA